MNAGVCVCVCFCVLYERKKAIATSVTSKKNNSNNHIRVIVDDVGRARSSASKQLTGKTHKDEILSMCSCARVCVCVYVRVELCR